MFLLDYVVTPRLPPAFHVMLPEGATVLVRHVVKADGPRLQEGFRMLSSLARRKHFPGEVQELGAEQLRLLEEVDQKNYVIWGAMNPSRPDEPGIGIARYRRIEHEPDAADVVITILDRYQGTGAGLILHACLHVTARDNGIRHFYYDVGSENERFIRHLKNLGAEHVGRVVGVTRLKLPVYPRALSVPKYSASGWKLAQALRKLTAVRAAPAGAAAG
ncbi:MAG TPA: N-acetyltransferase [Candidatus Binatia bacterium]|nr:N-acetyltransferase [Candidatus Binatia bacterium]